MKARILHPQRGVALLQVLLLSMVISLLLLQLVYTARGQLSVAREVEQRIHADLIIYSARNEALFASLVLPESYDRDALSWVSGVAGGKHSLDSSASGFSVSTRLRDVSGFLPLRFPEHPLWPRTLALLGMERGAAQQFLYELKHMQDLDLDGVSISKEPDLSSSGFEYPNLPIQMPNSIKTWVQLDPIMQQRIESISHHYMLDTVNFLAAPEPVVEATMGGYGLQINRGAEFADDREQLKRYLADAYPYWVSLSSSGLWRLEIVVEADKLRRRARYDFSVTMKDEPPFTIVGN